MTWYFYTQMDEDGQFLYGLLILGIMSLFTMCVFIIWMIELHKKCKNKNEHHR